MQSSISCVHLTQFWTLALVFISGCPSGDKAGDDSAKSTIEGEDSGHCGVSTTTLTVSVEAEDAYAETFFRSYPEHQTLSLAILFLPTEPESDQDCSHHGDYVVYGLPVDLGSDVEVEVPVGWVCGEVDMEGVHFVPGSTDFIDCSGDMATTDVSGCGVASIAIAVRCIYVFTDYGALHAAPREGSLQVGAGVPAPQTERHQAPPRWRPAP